MVCFDSLSWQEREILSPDNHQLITRSIFMTLSTLYQLNFNIVKLHFFQFKHVSCSWLRIDGADVGCGQLTPVQAWIILKQRMKRWRWVLMMRWSNVRIAPAVFTPPSSASVVLYNLILISAASLCVQHWQWIVLQLLILPPTLLRELEWMFWKLWIAQIFSINFLLNIFLDLLTNIDHKKFYNTQNNCYSS